MPLRSHGSKLLRLAAVFAAGALPGSVEAATTCAVSGAQLVFGSFTSIAGLGSAGDLDRDTTADLAITCTGDSGTTLGVEVQLDGGSTGNPSNRQLSGPGVLAYNIYADAARTQVWGDGSAGTGQSATITLSPGSSSGSATLTAYGRIPRGQRNVPVGAYTDTVLLTVVY